MTEKLVPRLQAEEAEGRASAASGRLGWSESCWVFDFVEHAKPALSTYGSELERLFARLQRFGASRLPAPAALEGVAAARATARLEQQFKASEGCLPADQRVAPALTSGKVRRVYVSARTGEGLDELRQIVRDFFYADMVEREIALPPTAARFRAQLFEQHAVRDEHTDDDGTMHLRVQLPYRRLRVLCREAGIEPPPPPAVAGEPVAS